MPSFNALENSSDPNAVLFHAQILQLKDYLNTQEYRQQVEEELNNQQSLSDDQLKNVLEGVKQQMPLYGIITDFLWLIEGFAFFSVFLLISNIIFYPLTAIYALIGEQIIKLIQK